MAGTPGHLPSCAQAATFGQDITELPSADAAPKYKLAPEAMARVYHDIVMPMTKQVQVAYLLRRLDDSSGAP